MRVMILRIVGTVLANSLLAFLKLVSYYILSTFGLTRTLVRYEGEIA